jgi:hypothetical protein
MHERHINITAGQDVTLSGSPNAVASDTLLPVTYDKFASMVIHGYPESRLLRQSHMTGDEAGPQCNGMPLTKKRDLHDLSPTTAYTWIHGLDMHLLAAALKASACQPVEPAAAAAPAAPRVGWPSAIRGCTRHCGDQSTAPPRAP